MQGAHGQTGFFGKVLQLETIAQTQGIEHVLKGQIGAANFRLLSDSLPCQGIFCIKPWFAPAHLAHDAVRKTEFAVRACPNAQVVAKLPVIQIMKATVAGFGIGRDLITLHARLSCHLGDAVEHGIGQVFLRYHRRKLGKVGVGLNGQVVNRDVGRIQGQCLAHVFFEAFQGLAGQGIHDVQVKGLKIGSRFLHCGNRLRAVMHPAQRFQVRVIKALNADR